MTTIPIRTNINFLSVKRVFSLIILSYSFLVILPSFAAKQKAVQSTSIQKQLAKLEASAKGRIGVYAINTANNTHIGYRENERFPTGCTSKIIGVAAILNISMHDKTLLTKRIRYLKKDLVNWNPITEKYLSSGMTIKELCAASISYSDNTAMNLLVFATD